MKKLILIAAIFTLICSCKKPTDDPMPANTPTLYFLEYDVPANTTVTSIFGDDTIVDAPKSGPSHSFATIDKHKFIKYSATNPITIRVRERILNNYNGKVYLLIENTTSGTLDLSSIPE